MLPAGERFLPVGVFGQGGVEFVFGSEFQEAGEVCLQGRHVAPLHEAVDGWGFPRQVVAESALEVAGGGLVVRVGLEDAADGGESPGFIALQDFLPVFPV